MTSSRLSRSLTRYRVMAWVTGIFLLLLTLEMLLKYVLAVNGANEPVLGDWIAITHGWIYAIYLVTVLDLWTKLRWGPRRLAVLVLAGVVPVLSFVAEHRVTGEARAVIAAHAATGSTGEGSTTLAR